MAGLPTWLRAASSQWPLEVLQLNNPQGTESVLPIERNTKRLRCVLVALPPPSAGLRRSTLWQQSLRTGAVTEQIICGGCRMLGRFAMTRLAHRDESPSCPVILTITVCCFSAKRLAHCRHPGQTAGGAVLNFLHFYRHAAKSSELDILSGDAVVSCFQLWIRKSAFNRFKWKSYIS